MKSKTAVLMIVLMGMALATAYGMDQSLVRSENVDIWENVDWDDMTDAEKELWKDLGWSEVSWNGEARQPDSEDKYWNQLSDKERTAAEKLGYTKASWNE